MAVSRNSTQVQNDSFFDRLSAQLSRYDLLLAAIPLMLALAVVAGVVFSVSLHLSVSAAALFCSPLLVDAMYVNPPTDSS
jgi:hypothetical protein